MLEDFANVAMIVAFGWPLLFFFSSAIAIALVVLLVILGLNT
jgi:hypothetical protein